MPKAGARVNATALPGPGSCNRAVSPADVGAELTGSAHIVDGTLISPEMILALKSSSLDTMSSMWPPVVL